MGSELVLFVVLPLVFFRAPIAASVFRSVFPSYPNVHGTLMRVDDVPLCRENMRYSVNLARMLHVCICRQIRRSAVGFQVTVGLRG